MLLVGNGRLITSNDVQPYLADGCLAINDNLIVETGRTVELRQKYAAGEFLDAGGKIIMPGMVNTHMHLYSAFARGMALKDPPPAIFTQILEQLWWRLDKVLTLEEIYYSALISLIDCVKNGTTTVFDHHASPGAVRDSLFTIARAAKKVGVRGCLCYEVSDRGGVAVMAQGVAENTEFLKYARQAENDMVKGMFGLHASLTLSDRTLAKCGEANAGSGAGFHIHAAEGIEDLQDCLQRYGQSVVQRLENHGVLGPQTIAAHCVHINQDDISLLRHTETKVVHNPESNMGNAVGCAPVLELCKQGVYPGLGTDGYTSDMFESLKVANILHKHSLGNPSAWGEAPTMLFANNAAICRQYFTRPLGRLVPGGYADVIIVDYNPPTPMNENNINGHILFGMSGRAVDTTIINGRVVMRDRCLAGIDEQEICAKARELARKVWEKF